MNSEVKRLIEQIRRELKDIDRALQRAEEGLVRAKRSSDDYYLDSVALNIHGFYNGLERIFERIAVIIDGQKPAGEHWHQALLEQMNSDIPELRSAVISDTTYAALDEYRGFRHVVRNIYTFNLLPDQLSELVADGPSLFDQVQAELLAFTKFLEEKI